MHIERKQKPVDVWDHTNAIGCGMACMVLTAIEVVIAIVAALIIYSFYNIAAWLVLPIVLFCIPATWIWLYSSDSTWTREEAAETGREQEWDSAA